MRQLTVISGKGGTGKTSVVASFAALSESCVLADCDVDAADLHLILQPEIKQSEVFHGSKLASIVSDKCTACGRCHELCKFDAITSDGNGSFRVDPLACEGCGVCAWFCPQKAINFDDAVNGHWYISDTRCGELVHAKLATGGENSGKLVTTVRQAAVDLAENSDKQLVIIDGSPGVGCPVIASLTAADMVLIVTEPTLSGLHDLQRVGKLIAHFGLKSTVCINKWDINPEVSDQIESHCRENGISIAAKIRYDKDITAAQIKGLSVVEYKSDGCSEDIRQLWRSVNKQLAETTAQA